MSAHDDVELILAQIPDKVAVGSAPELSVADIGDGLSRLAAELRNTHQAILLLAERIDQMGDGGHPVFI